MRNIKMADQLIRRDTAFSGTIQVSQYQKGKTNLVLLKQETMSGSGSSWSLYILKTSICSELVEQV